jgi:hypothetical protein
MDDIGCYVPSSSESGMEAVSPGIWRILQSRDGYREELSVGAGKIPIGSDLR